jgi:SAM-dependent methyltransferase
MAWSSYPNFVKNLINYIERDLCYYFDAYDNSPVNFRPLDSSTEALQKDVEHSLLVSDFYLKNLPDGEQLIKGKKVLEIGPGINLGPILTLACHGAKVMVADRFLSPWDPDYHHKFYTLLRDRLINRWPSINLTPLDMVLSQGGYPPDSISLHFRSLEELSEVPDQSIDVVISNAVLEHLYDLKSAFSHLGRITKPGGFGLHTVDFRDHRDFSRPLEYLLLSNKEFSREFKERHGECGNRYRPQEMGQLLELVGFEVNNLHPILSIEEEYLAEFLGRLRQARKSRYRNYPAEDLRLMIGRFNVVKKHAKPSENVVRKMSFLSRLAGSLGQHQGIRIDRTRDVI